MAPLIGAAAGGAAAALAVVAGLFWWVRQRRARLNRVAGEDRDSESDRTAAVAGLGSHRPGKSGSGDDVESLLQQGGTAAIASDVSGSGKQQQKPMSYDANDTASAIPTAPQACRPQPLTVPPTHRHRCPLPPAKAINPTPTGVHHWTTACGVARLEAERTKLEPPPTTSTRRVLSPCR